MPEQPINMPDQPVSDSHYFRELARKARINADQALGDAANQLLLRIAQTYEYAADRVEQRFPVGEKSK
jgi:hypothetical protein